jgi:hypothetical protein
MQQVDVIIRTEPVKVDVVLNALYDTTSQTFILGDEDGNAIGSDAGDYIQ